MHVRVYHQKENFVCNLCSYETSKKNLLTNHMIFQHTKDFPFKCDLCPEGFLSKKALNMHYELHKTDDRQCHVCPFCAKKITTLNSLGEHQKTDSGENFCVCDVCGLAFITKTKLENT